MPDGVWSFGSGRAKLRIKAIEKLLSDQVPRTAAAIAQAVHLDKSHGTKYMKYLHDNKRAFIKKWFRPGCPMWLMGEGRDAKEPKKKTHAQRQSAYHKRMKNDPEYRMKLQSKNRLRRMPSWNGQRRRVIAGSTTIRTAA